MNKKISQIIALSLCCVLLIVTFSGCIEEEQKSEETKEILPSEFNLDQPSILPDWEDGEYHDYYETTDLLNEFQIKYPDLVNVFSIGESVQGKDICCIRITNEKNKQDKFSCLIDGCMHGIEWEAGEACLYLADYLLINFGKNKTIDNILNASEVYIVPLFNPDGRQNDEFGNYNGVDLNRNFDIFFGRVRSRCLRLGPILSKKLGPIIKFPPNDQSKWWRNSGRRPFSEPESRAISSLMKTLSHNDFSFYVNCHTAWHNILMPVPWAKSILNPPFVITEQEKDLFDYVRDWIEENTEYEADRSKDNNVGGFTDYWCFQEFRIPVFCFEMLSLDYDAQVGEKKHDHLVHWMKTTLPFFMYLLVNIENLHDWKLPDIQPELPEGIPPDPLN